MYNNNNINLLQKVYRSFYNIQDITLKVKCTPAIPKE